MRLLGSLAICVTFLSLAAAPQGSDSSGTSYHVAQRYGIPGDGDWDYISIDSKARRLYVSHGDQLEVLDADSGKLVGKIADTPGVHGAALASEFHRGFTSNGHDKSVTIFDTKTLATIKKVQLQTGTDFILYDLFSKRVFPMNERTSVIDAQTGEIVGILDLGGSPEAAVSDGKGTIYVNLIDKNAVAVVDPKALTVTKTYPINGCTGPDSLSYDGASQRLFIGCSDGFAALDVTAGKVVRQSLMCSGVDASGFDSENKLVFESCAEGVISVIRETTPDYYELVATIPTQLHARTMAFDSITKKIFLPTAEFDTFPNTDPTASSPFKRQRKPGSFTVLVVSRH